MGHLPPRVVARWDQDWAGATTTLTRLVDREHQHRADHPDAEIIAAANAAQLALTDRQALVVLSAAAIRRITDLEAAVAPLCPTCRKRTYPDLGAGFDAALSESRRLGHGMRVYACPNRRGWHLTSRPDWPTRTARKDAA